MNPSSSRLYFLDWVRIIAFLLLIVYHVGMYYVTWEWHVKSPHASEAIQPFMMMSSPWRLSLLFLISGVAASFMLAKVGALRFMGQRSVRLLVPLIFGMFVIVPPQAYFQVIEQFAYKGSYAEFMQLYVDGSGGFCSKSDCLDMPTWNHLWFVAYLWVYTLVLGMIMLVLGPRFDSIARKVVSWLTGWKLIVLPVAVLGAVRVALLTEYPVTHGLFDDWYNHATSLPLFVLGAMLGRASGAWQRFDAARWTALALAFGCWAALVVYFSLPESIMQHPDINLWRTVMRFVYMLCAWSAIVAACGFAHRHLNRDNASRAYLTEAVFPVYILHQTLIVSIAHLIKPANVAPAAEGPMLIVLTLTISFGVFELVRRVAILRPLFGLGRTNRRDRAAVADRSQSPAHATS